MKKLVLAIMLVVIGSFAGYWAALTWLKPADVWDECTERGVEDVLTQDKGCDVHKAAREGNVRMLLRWVLNKEALNRPDEHGNTPLHVAAGASQREAVQILLTAGADTGIRNTAGKLAEEMVTDMAVQFAFEYAKKVRKEELAAYQHARDGENDAVIQALREGINPNAVTDNQNNRGRDLLGESCWKCKAEVVQALLDAGADTSLKRGKMSAISVAVQGDRADLIPILIRGGFSPFAQNPGNEAFLLHDAVYSYRQKALQVLIPYFRCMELSPYSHALGTPITLAIDRGNPEAYRALIQAGVKPEDPRYKDRPLLVIAAIRNRPKIAKMLIDAGVDKNAKDKFGKCAADYAKGQIAELLKNK